MFNTEPVYFPTKRQVVRESVLIQTPKMTTGAVAPVPHSCCV